MSTLLSSSQASKGIGGKGGRGMTTKARWEGISLFLSSTLTSTSTPSTLIPCRAFSLTRQIKHMIFHLSSHLGVHTGCLTSGPHGMPLGWRLLINTHLWLDVLHLHTTHAMRQYTGASCTHSTCPAGRKEMGQSELWLQQQHVCGVYRIGM